MKEFIEKYKDRIHGVLSCFDRMLFRGYLPIMSGWQMGTIFQQLWNSVSATETVSAAKRRACQTARPDDRRTGKTAICLSSRESQEGGDGQGDRPTGPCPGRTDLYSFGHGALSDVLIPDGKRKTLRGLGSPQVLVLVFLFQPS